MIFQNKLKCNTIADVMLLFSQSIICCISCQKVKCPSQFVQDDVLDCLLNTRDVFNTNKHSNLSVKRPRVYILLEMFQIKTPSSKDDFLVLAFILKLR